MAYDLEEQEQLATVKGWWNDNGTKVLMTDFAGQHAYVSTHRFFLGGNNSVYAVVASLDGAQGGCGAEIAQFTDDLLSSAFGRQLTYWLDFLDSSMSRASSPKPANVAVQRSMNARRSGRAASETSGHDPS